MDTIKNAMGNLGFARMTIMGGVLIGLVAFFIYLLTRVSSPNMGLLYSDLDLAESGQIVSKLDSLGIPVDVRGDGSQIYIPSDKVGRMRMLLAEAGLPTGGSLGYEVFDKNDSIGTTSFVQDINHVRALEGELSKTIRTISGVSNARVHLVLPKRELFSRDRQNASASIFLKMKGSKRLSKEQVQSVRQLVAAAIPGLLTHHITVVDNQGTLLARGDGDEQSFSAASTAEEMRQAFENNLSQNLEKLIESTLGPNKAKVEVFAEINFDKSTENTEEFNPEGQVIRSSQTLSDNSTDGSASSFQSQTVTNNLPGANAGGTGGASGSSTNKNSKTVNFEISKTVKTVVREGGDIKRVSVAALVDGTYSTDKDGKKIYQPLDNESIKKVTALIKSAVGYNESRGDKVEVVNMQFYLPDTLDDKGEEESFFSFKNQDLVRIIEIVVLGIVGILVLLLIVKPIITRMLEGGGAAMGGMGMLPGMGGGAMPQIPYGGASMPMSSPDGAPLTGGMPMMGGNYAAPMQAMTQMPGNGMPLMNAPQMPAGMRAPQQAQTYSGQEESLINIQQVDGRLKSSAVKQIEEIVDKHPEEAASIVRSWMYQD